MARSILSLTLLSLLACLSLALLELVSAERQNQELEAVLNQPVQTKPEEVQARMLREADAKKKPKSKKKGKKTLKPKRKGKKTQKPKRKGKKTQKPKSKRKGKKIRRQKSKGKGKKTRRQKSKGKGKKTRRQKSKRKGKKTRRQKSKRKGKKTRKQKSKKKGKKTRKQKSRKKVKKSTTAYQERQNATCNVTGLCQQIKNYIKYSNQLRKVKRIEKTCSTMAKKAAKAGGGEFNASATANTDTDDANVTAIANGLKNCTATAKANCETKAVNGCIDTAGNKKCQKELEDWIAKFGPAKGSCLQKAADCCACINAISPAPSKNCLSFDAIDIASKAKKKKCTGSDTKGSFGYCRKLQMSAAEKGPTAAKKKCKGMGGGTTAGAAGRRMVYRNSLLKKWIKT